MNKQITFLISLLLALGTNAQNLEWARSFGGTSSEEGNSITVDASGNVYTTGRFQGTVDFDPGAGTNNLTSNGNWDVFIQKLDPSGNFLWAKSFGGTSYDHGYSITVDASGNVYTTGLFQGTVDFDPEAGTNNLTSNGNWDVFIQKLNPSGNFLWAKSFGGPASDWCYSITVDASGNVYTTGPFQGTVDFDPGAGTNNLTAQGSRDAFIQKLDPSGNFLWAKSFGGHSSDQGASITVDASGNVYTTGLFSGTVDFDPGAGTNNLSSQGNLDAFIQKLDPSGNFIWAKSFGGTSLDQGLSITVDASGNVYTTGRFDGTVDFDPGAGTNNLSSQGGYDDAFIQKLDPSGNFIWAKSFGGTSNDRGLSITVDASGNVYTTGFFRDTVDFDPGAGTNNLSSQGTDDVFIQKLDPSGNFLWAKSFGGTSLDWGHSITVDASGNVYTTGYFYGTVDFDPGAGTNNLTSQGSVDIFIQKMSQCSPTTGTDVQTACDTYTWIDGNTYTSSNNTATHTLTNLAGCDSVVTLNLSINNSNTGTDVITACDSYTWIDGNTYTASNNAVTVTLTNAAGCDSTVTLNLTITNSNTGTDVITACDSYTWIDGVTYTNNNNIATQTLTNAAGCDSVVTLDLTITNSTAAMDVQTACDSYTWIDGQTYTASNNAATVTLTNAAGCDSVVTLDLTITNSTAATDLQTACDSYTWIDGNTYTASNNAATVTLTNAAGCDSVVTLDLTITNSTAATDVQTACDSYTWIDGQTYTASNNAATVTLTNAAGCDSVVTLDLTITNSTAATDVQTACDSYTWIDGQTYTASNNAATVTLTNAAGCDSVVTLDLTINNVSDINTSVNGLTITANNANASYVWLDCDDNYSVLAGETNQSYTATSNGNYAVQLTENGCVDTSDCVAITTVGILENTFSDKFLLYPNPTNGAFSIQFGSPQTNVELKIMDLSGKVIENRNFANVVRIEHDLDEPKGIYLIEVSNGKGERSMIRLLKQ
jgi:PDZ domain-containing secreted protein